MQLASFEESLLVERQVLTHEDAFWEQLVHELLDHKLDPIENVANLKSDLEKLRNTAVCLHTHVHGQYIYIYIYIL